MKKEKRYIYGFKVGKKFKDYYNYGERVTINKGDMIDIIDMDVFSEDDLAFMCEYFEIPLDRIDKYCFVSIYTKENFIDLFTDGEINSKWENCFPRDDLPLFLFNIKAKPVEIIIWEDKEPEIKSNLKITKEGIYYLDSDKVYKE